jgi:hypothetical protein
MFVFGFLKALLGRRQAEVRQPDNTASRYKGGKCRVLWTSPKCMWCNGMRTLFDVLENMKSYGSSGELSEIAIDI